MKKYTDVYLKVKMSDHEYFKREGNNIITTNYVTVSQYILGGVIKIMTIYGEKEVTVEKYKDKIEINGLGVGRRGKHIINLQIKIPTVLNEEQREIINEIKKYEV